MVAPIQPFGDGASIAPRYAENVKRGPGTACVIPVKCHQKRLAEVLPELIALFGRTACQLCVLLVMLAVYKHH